MENAKNHLSRILPNPPPQVMKIIYAREYWAGDSRDGCLINGDGYHYYKMDESGFIFEAFEYYETDDGREFVTPIPEMQNISWLKDLGFESLDELDLIEEDHYNRIKEMSNSTPS